MGHKYEPKEPNASIHPQDVYTSEMHEVNLEIVRDYMAHWGKDLGDNKQTTPWLVTDQGLARLQINDGDFKGEFVETRERGYYGLAAHFVKHTVEINPVGIGGKSKIYPPVHQALGIMFLGQPVSGGFLMGYPTVNYHPRAASDMLTTHLHNPEQQVEANKENLQGLFADRSIALRRWVKVKL